jgi:hypothetical protein
MLSRPAHMSVLMFDGSQLMTKAPSYPSTFRASGLSGRSGGIGSEGERGLPDAMADAAAGVVKDVSWPSPIGILDRAGVLRPRKSSSEASPMATEASGGIWTISRGADNQHQHARVKRQGQARSLCARTERYHPYGSKPSPRIIPTPATPGMISRAHQSTRRVLAATSSGELLLRCRPPSSCPTTFASPHS